MKKGEMHTPALCAPFHHAIELIGRRWTGAIISLLLQSRCRFATLRDAIPEITDRMLSERLQKLETEGIVERTVIPETPVRVEYALTKKGRALAAVGRSHDFRPPRRPEAVVAVEAPDRGARLRRPEW